MLPIDTSSVIATADSALCDSTVPGAAPAGCAHWDPDAVFDGADQDYCSAAVPPGTRVPDADGTLGWLQVQFANPVAISGYTLGVKGSCTWDMPTGWAFQVGMRRPPSISTILISLNELSREWRALQGSVDGLSWTDLDVVTNQVGLPRC